MARTLVVLNDFTTNCCGLAGVHSFGYPGDSASYRLTSTSLQEAERRVRRRRKGAAFVTLSSDQTHALTLVRSKRTWKQVFEFYNPNSGNTVYVFMKAFNQPRKERNAR